jgi:hypothetical protein
VASGTAPGPLGAATSVAAVRVVAAGAAPPSSSRGATSTSTSGGSAGKDAFATTSGGGAVKETFALELAQNRLLQWRYTPSLPPPPVASSPGAIGVLWGSISGS